MRILRYGVAVLLVSVLNVSFVEGKKKHKCPGDTVYSERKEKCVCRTRGYKFNKASLRCEAPPAGCPAGQELDPKTQRCHAKCPAGQVWGSAQQRCLLAKCPEGFDQVGTKCVCPPSKKQVGGQCVAAGPPAMGPQKAQAGQPCGLVRDARGNARQVQCAVGLTCHAPSGPTGTCMSGAARRQATRGALNEACGETRLCQEGLSCVSGRCAQKQATATGPRIAVTAKVTSGGFATVHILVQNPARAVVQLELYSDESGAWSKVFGYGGAAQHAVSRKGKPVGYKAVAVIAGQRLESNVTRVPARQ